MRNTKWILLISILLVEVTYLSAYSQCAVDYSNFDLVFEDNFDGTVTDLSDNWFFEFTWGNAIEAMNPGEVEFKACNQIKNLSISDGNLRIGIQKEVPPLYVDNRYWNYSTAMLRSNYADDCAGETGFLYGMFEIRCKFPTWPGMATAFWLTGSNAWPPEIDVFEFNARTKDFFFSTNHWHDPICPRNDCSCSINHSYAPKDLTDDFHTYTLVWTPTEIAWFFDNKEIQAETRNVPTGCAWRKMNMIISYGLNWPDYPIDEEDYFIIDYVRAYKQIDLNQPYREDGDCDNYDLICDSWHTLLDELETGTGDLSFKIFPNPFSNSMTLEFNIPEGGQVNFDLYDIYGRRISTLYNGNIASNIIYKIKVNFEKYPAGIYFGKLISNSQKGVYKKFIHI